MGFFRKLGRLAKKVGGRALSAASVLGVPGAGLAVRAAQAARSFGEDTKKLRLAQRARLVTGPQLRDPINTVLAPPRAARIKAPRVTLAATGAQKTVSKIRASQLLRLKAGKVSPERQKLLYDEWVLLGKPGTWEEYLMDQVSQGLVS